MNNNFKLLLSYDGTGYLGWQKTKIGPSIEGCLEKALSQILQHKIRLQAASRTDAGVHAHGQVVNFFSPEQDLNLRKLQMSLNGLLPHDISVLDLKNARSDFHPTLDCKAKEYHYFICNHSIQLPFHRHFSWHYYYPLDLEAMKKAAALLIGTHDFSAFCNKNNRARINNKCTIYALEINPAGLNRLQIIIRGNKFLYNMARNIAGTLTQIGSKHLSIESLISVLKNGNRTQAGITAPAHGLVLEKVLYDFG